MVNKVGVETMKEHVSTKENPQGNSFNEMHIRPNLQCQKMYGNLLNK